MAPVEGNAGAAETRSGVGAGWAGSLPEGRSPWFAWSAWQTLQGEAVGP